MNERTYTVKEIDDLRSVCETRYLYGSTVLNGGMRMSRGYRERDKVLAVEEMVRTHMVAGHTAQDIIDADNTKQHERERRIAEQV